MRRFAAYWIKSVFLVAATLLQGCGTHNVPTQSVPFGVRDQQMTVHVDQFGRSFPANWDRDYGEPVRFDGYSLELRAKSRGHLSKLGEQAAAMLQDFEEFARNKKRLIFFVHGYNAAASESEEVYQKLTNRLALSKDDATVHFFWDGLIATVPLLGDARIWFWACGNSHLAGTNGLRPLLNRLAGKEVILVAHSRGAHVVLSALSNPRVKPEFARKTNAVMARDMFSDPPLQDQGNAIQVLLLAPAVGRVDFFVPNAATGQSYRSLGPQLKKIVHTVNPEDQTLKKYFSGLSDNFNSTDLGYSSELSRELQAHYPFIEEVAVTNLPAHGFGRYVDNAEVTQAFQRVGLFLRPPDR